MLVVANPGKQRNLALIYFSVFKLFRWFVKDLFRKELFRWEDLVYILSIRLDQTITFKFLCASKISVRYSINFPLGIQC